jgi:hypothetical protein
MTAAIRTACHIHHDPKIFPIPVIFHLIFSLKLKIAESLFAFRLKTSSSQAAPIKQKGHGQNARSLP